MTASHPSRADRRRTTEQRILSTARTIFAARGFERTTIRAVAAAAEVDPALVMQYFGSKQELFSRAIQMPTQQQPVDSPVQLTELLLATLGMKIGGLPQASVAMMRSMLTHPEATATTRATLNRQIEEISAAIPAENAQLRAALIITTMVGVTIGQQLLDLDALRDTTSEQVVNLLRPYIHGLVSGET